LKILSLGILPNPKNFINFKLYILLYFKYTKLTNFYKNNKIFNFKKDGAFSLIMLLKNATL